MHHDTKEFQHKPRLIFIHSMLDELGLSPAEFRVYAHLSRRADKTSSAWPGLRSIARICRMNKSTAAAAIARLISIGLITAQSSKGAVTVYHVRTKDEFLGLSENRAQFNGGGVSESRAHHCLKIGNKSNSTEVLPGSNSTLRDEPDKRIFCRVSKTARDRN